MYGGYVALHRPTFGEGLDFAVSINDQFDDVVDDVLERNGIEVSDNEEAGGGAAASRSRSDGGEMVRRFNNAT